MNPTKVPGNKAVTAPNGITLKINIAEALKMRIVNKMSFQQIANHFNVSKTAVFQSLKRFTDILVEPQELENYQHYKSALLSSAELRLLQRLVTDDVVEKASLNNVAYAFRQIFDSNRLEQNKSTCNISSNEIDRELAEIRKRRTDLQKQMDSTKAINADYTILEEEKENKNTHNS